MALTYDQDTRLSALSPVLDEYGAWFSHVLRQVVYPDKKAVLPAPDSFLRWAEDAVREGTVGEQALETLRRLHTELQRSAADLVAAAADSGAKPPVAVFDSLVTLHDEFIAHIRRLEQETSESAAAFDPRTGLRTLRAMMSDVPREMERLSRHGRPFCLGLSRIDHFEKIEQQLPLAEQDKIILAATAAIKECLRSFDDAYYLSDGEFMMCLKQTEVTGAVASMNRLRQIMIEQAPYYHMEGREIRLSMSSCVAEPQPGDSIEDLIRHMRNDLDRYGGDAGTALEYFEVSPLQRFLADGGHHSDKKPR